MPSAKILLAHLVLQERRAARHGAAVDGARQMADQAARDAAVVDHRHARALRLARIEAADDELAGIAADLGRRHQVLEMDGARPFVVALHAGALAAQHRAGQRIAAAAIAAGEAVAGGQHHRDAAPARLGALGIGDALDGAGGVLGFGGHAPAAPWPTAAACRRDRGRASCGPAIPPGRCRRPDPPAPRAPCRRRVAPACAAPWARNRSRRRRPGAGPRTRAGRGRGPRCSRASRARPCAGRPRSTRR